MKNCYLKCCQSLLQYNADPMAKDEVFFFSRFIARYCPVAEFGLVGATMHRADECVPVADLRDLARIYREIIAAFLA